MKRISCQQLLNIETISFAFKNNQGDTSDQIISCFYSCYRDLFVQWAKITYRHYPADMIAFLANTSFTDGVLKFKESASSGELYAGNASVKTILFYYCKNILLGHLTNEKRLEEKKQKQRVLIAEETAYNMHETESEIKEWRHKNIMQSMAKMSAADRQIIQWRHIEEKSPDEIAALLAIKVESTTNRIYRCMQRLRKLVDEMEKKL